MKNAKKYIRTDLAAESMPLPETLEDANNAAASGILYNEETKSGYRVETIRVLNERGEAVTGRPVGTYVTITVGKLWLASDEQLDAAAEIIADILSDMAKRLAPGGGGVLVCGLGNREITSDAIGPLAVRDVTVTRHIKSSDSRLFSLLGGREISAIAPGVVGQTGIETLELVRGAVQNSGPALLVVIDALAARSTDRLATTIQLCDTGISPGSGIGGSRKAINQEQLGIPVIAIGVPTIVDSSTLVCDALEKAGINDIPNELEQVLENGRSFFVSRGDSDVAVQTLSSVIAEAINMAFLGS
ncbi:MAG TPA: GPR endopeptidase [Bacillota bacterium]|nr:GPR endopeptidase [Bacillota bacterium]